MLERTTRLVLKNQNGEIAADVRPDNGAHALVLEVEYYARGYGAGEQDAKEFTLKISLDEFLRWADAIRQASKPVPEGMTQ